MPPALSTLPACLLSLALLAGCAADRSASPSPVPPPAASAGEAWYRQAQAAGEPVFAIDPAQSLITVTVRRGGPLARLGHDHVVASRTITGFAAPRTGRAHFHFRLDQMTVDEAALRAAAGLETTPTPEAIEGTRNNMLNKVLEAERYPVVALSAQRIAGVPGKLRLAVTLHGVTRSMDVAASVEQTSGRLIASGAFTLLQTDFGITPMSVMGGAMTVQDRMELAFRIVAAPLATASARR